MYPTFGVNSTSDKKELAISEFTRDTHAIKAVNTVQEFPNNQFIDAINKAYVLELKQ
jgi:hypothetical protein